MKLDRNGISASDTTVCVVVHSFVLLETKWMGKKHCFALAMRYGMKSRVLAELVFSDAVTTEEALIMQHSYRKSELHVTIFPAAGCLHDTIHHQRSLATLHRRSLDYSGD